MGRRNKGKALAVLPPRGAMSRRVPHGMKGVTLDFEQKAFVQRQALEIFTEAANSGRPFADCLTAVYLSGSSLALAAMREGE